MCVDILSTKEFWCHFDIKIAVSTTCNTWDKPNSHHVNGMWKKPAKILIWRKDGSSHYPPPPSITSQVSQAWVTPGPFSCRFVVWCLSFFTLTSHIQGRQWFLEVNKAHVNQLPVSKQQDLSNEGLLALEQRYIELNQSSPEEDQPVTSIMTKAS